MTTISSINSQPVTGMFPPPPMERGQKLTDDQKSKLQEILAKYDSESATDEEIKSMLDEIKETGIRPSEDLKNTLQEAGFELKPPQGGPPPMGPNGATGAPPEAPQFVQDFMSKIQSGDVTEDDLTTFLETLKSQTPSLTGIIIDKKS